MPVQPASARQISWSKIRHGIKDTITLAAPNARVHSRWALQFDLESTIAMIRNDSDIIHSWMVMVKKPSADIAKVGGTEYETTLDFKIWGMMGYDYGDDSSNSQDAFEDEVDDVIATLRANSNVKNAFGLTNADGVQAIREVIIPSEFDLDVMGFGEGHDVHVAQGILQVRIVR
jgi:hypothetical protein